MIYIISGKMHSGKDTLSNFIIKNSDKKCIKLSYAFYLKEYAKKICNWDGNDEVKPRKFLQEIGDIAKKIDPKILIRRMIEDIKIYLSFYDNIIITDARFIDEIIDIRKEFKKVIVIRINRNYKIDNHISEIALDDYNGYDYIINNNNNLESLELNAKKIVSEVENV